MRYLTLKTLQKEIKLIVINIKEKERIVETLRSTNNIDIYNINDYITRIPLFLSP